jgi:hypothetical protein
VCVCSNTSLNVADRCAFVVILRRILFKITNVFDKSCREEHDFMFNNMFYENHAIYETMRKNVVEPDWPRMTLYMLRTKDPLCIPAKA